MNWLDRRIDDFIRRVRDAHPVGIDEHNPIAIGGKKVLVGDPPSPGSGSNVVGEAFRIENPTYWRWYVWPRNRFINCYLHNFLRDDEEDLHDHRMVNISVVLSRIGYREELYLRRPEEGLPLPGTYLHSVKYLRPRVRLPSTPHRVVLYKGKRAPDEDERPIAIWSLFIGFPHWRDWGFYKNDERGIMRWISWQEYIGVVDPTSSDYGIPKEKRETPPSM
jgi:hypothetical protein